MQKTGKAGNHGSRVVAKKLWKSRSKSQSRTSLSSACVWTPQASCQWVNIQSRTVTLCDTTLLQLTEMEAAAVQQVALQRLVDFNLGCTVRIPKDFNVTAGHKPKRRPYLLKKRPLTTGFFDTAKRDEKGNNNNAQGMVFGIPLKTCMDNDRRLRGRGGSPLRDRLDETLSRKSSHGGSHASFSSLMDAIRDKTSGSCESLNIMEKRSSVQDSSLSLASDGGGGEAALQPHVPQVPQLVSACIRHIETHGLHTVGIFRVSSSKKRSRQLREEFDSGADVKLSDDLCPHDVATLIKEYFRDLPEPLLPHDLYQPFLASQKIRNRKHQFDCLQHLIQLLAVPNRDTLCALLCFLKKVADCSADRRTAAGEWLTGNRMDSNNLATLFAPNMLHSLAKLGSELSQQTAERIDVINVIRSLIDHNKELFEVSAELLHEAYQLLMDKQPEALDVLLRRRLTVSGDEIDLELDTSSSVFEGSECSSQPAAATNRERTRDGDDEQRRTRKRETVAQEPNVSKPTVERSRRFRRRQEADSGRERSRRRDKSGSREDLAGGGGGGGGWFRRRVRSSSSTRQPSEELRSSEERPAGPRWFRRREKSSSQASDSGSEPRGRRGSLQAADRPLLMHTAPRQRSSSDQTVAAPAPQLAGRCERRLSSPELDVSGVITASLTIPAPASTNALSSAGAGATDDIPYIEECQTVSGLDDVFAVQHASAPVLDSRQRRRSSSSDSNCSEQPITGSLSIQPLLTRSASGLPGDKGVVITAGGEPARPQMKMTRSPSADSAASVVSEVSGRPAAPPAAAPRRRVRSPPAAQVTLGQLVLPSGGGAEMARSRTAPNISQHTVVTAPTPVRRRQPASEESPTPEPRVRRRPAEAEAPARRTRRPAGRSVTANVYELQKSESASPTVWKRRQLIASDSHSGV